MSRSRKDYDAQRAGAQWICVENACERVRSCVSPHMLKHAMARYATAIDRYLDMFSPTCSNDAAFHEVIRKLHRSYARECRRARAVVAHATDE